MTLTLYQLVGKSDDDSFSPYVWRARLALAHKGLEATLVPVRFTEKDKIAFSGGKTLPVLTDGEVVCTDSWDIACHLEDHYPDAPTLFGGPIGKAGACFIDSWVSAALFPFLFPMIALDVHDAIDDRDKAYFRQSRESRIGMTLEKFQQDRADKLPRFRAALGPLRLMLARQPFICGDSPAYGDYIVYGAFHWARGTSTLELLAADDPVAEWRERMLDLFDGLSRRAPSCPSSGGP